MGWTNRSKTEGTVDVPCTKIAPLEGSTNGEASLGKDRMVRSRRNTRKPVGGRETRRPTTRIGPDAGASAGDRTGHPATPKRAVRMNGKTPGAKSGSDAANREECHEGSDHAR
ncbi:hypothetical protein PF049_10640 [Erythrobacteraceae bacterium WH01K]|nr:hypothetical protein PF049_10640 [Erythrobacteraceae bacterium WH01K]